MNLQKKIDKLWYIIFWINGIALLLILSGIIFYLFWQGKSASNFNFWLDIPRGFPLGSEGGIYPAIKGTFYLLLLTLLFAGTSGVITGIYLSEYATNSKFKNFLNISIRSMAGIPSIITGLFVYALCVVKLSWGISLLAGGIALSIMVLPVIVITTQEALRAVSNEYRLTGIALGVSPTYTLFRIILPQAFPAIISGILIALGYAAGATAPIMVTAAAVAAPGDFNLFQPIMALPYHLYILFSEGVSVENAYATALVLLILLLVLNVGVMGIKVLARGGK